MTPVHLPSTIRFHNIINVNGKSAKISKANTNSGIITFVRLLQKISPIAKNDFFMGAAICDTPSWGVSRHAPTLAGTIARFFNNGEDFLWDAGYRLRRYATHFGLPRFGAGKRPRPKARYALHIGRCALRIRLTLARLSLWDTSRFLYDIQSFQDPMA